MQKYNQATLTWERLMFQTLYALVVLFSFLFHTGEWMRDHIFELSGELYEDMIDRRSYAQI